MNEIQEIYDVLNKILADDPVILSEQIRIADGYYARAGFLLAEAESAYEKAKLKNLVPKSRELTDIDRQIRLDAAVSKEREWRDKLEVLLKAIEHRRSLGQTLIKAHLAEPK